MPFTIDFSLRAKDHLAMLRKRDQQIIVDAISLQLTHQPEEPTRQRKKLEENPLAPWELRGGAFRVFYDVNRDEQLIVIVAVGHKRPNILRIGDEEIEL